MRNLLLVIFLSSLTFSVCSQVYEIDRFLFQKENRLEPFQERYTRVAQWKYDRLGVFEHYLIPDTSNSFFEIELLKTSDSSFSYFEYNSQLTLEARGEYWCEQSTDSFKYVTNFDEYGDIIREDKESYYQCYRTGKWNIYREALTSYYKNGVRDSTWTYFGEYKRADFQVDYRDPIAKTDTINLILKNSQNEIEINITKFNWHAYSQNSQEGNLQFHSINKPTIDTSQVTESVSEWYDASGGESFIRFTNSGVELTGFSNSKIPDYSRCKFEVFKENKTYYIGFKTTSQTLKHEILYLSKDYLILGD